MNAGERDRRARVVAASALAAAVGVVGAVVIAACGPGSHGGGGMMGGMTGMTGVAGGSLGGNCLSEQRDTSSAAIEGFHFCPAIVRVQAGTVVRWTNRDSTAHTVTSRAEGQFDSKSLGGNGSWSHRFGQPGTFSYYCALHPWMQGTVEVAAATMHFQQAPVARSVVNSLAKG